MKKTEMDMETVYAFLDLPGDYSLLGMRNRAIVAMVITSGMNASDIWRLKCSDLDTETGTIRQKKKISLHEECRKVLMEYMKYGRPVQPEDMDNGNLVITPDGRPVTKTVYLSALRRICRKAGARYVPGLKWSHKWPDMEEKALEILKKAPAKSSDERRDRLLFALRMAEDIEFHDICRLKIADVAPDYSSIGKDKDLQLSDMCTQRLRIYLGRARPGLVGNYAHDFMFVSKSGIALDRHNGQAVLCRICRNSGIPGITFTRLRHIWNENTEARIP